MSVSTNLKNIKWGEIPDGVVVKVWFWIKYKRINWAVYSEYSSPKPQSKSNNKDTE